MDIYLGIETFVKLVYFLQFLQLSGLTGCIWVSCKLTLITTTITKINLKFTIPNHRNINRKLHTVYYVITTIRPELDGIQALICQKSSRHMRSKWLLAFKLLDNCRMLLVVHIYYTEYQLFNILKVKLLKFLKVKNSIYFPKGKRESKNCQRIVLWLHLTLSMCVRLRIILWIYIVFGNLNWFGYHSPFEGDWICRMLRFQRMWV